MLLKIPPPIPQLNFSFDGDKKDQLERGKRSSTPLFSILSPYPCSFLPHLYLKVLSSEMDPAGIRFI
jgi:hypothetical protein